MNFEFKYELDCVHFLKSNCLENLLNPNLTLPDEKILSRYLGDPWLAGFVFHSSELDLTLGTPGPVDSPGRAKYLTFLAGGSR